METPTPTLRQQGVEALREGKIDTAIDLLARAVMADSQDAEAQAFLGVAYSQKGLHAQAKRALQTAVELQPRNAGFWFNLGVALEHAGDRPGAASAYRETLQINPEHAQARARAEALAAQIAASPAAAPRPASPPSGSSLSDAPWLRGQQSPPAAQVGPPGTVPCPQCKQWSKPGLSCEWCSAPLKSTRAPATAPWLQGGSTPSASEVAGPGPAVYVAPDMSAGEAFGRRFAAGLVDGLIVGAVAALSFPLLMQSGPGGLGKFQFIAILVAWVYAPVMLALRGQTLGKMALGVRVIGPDGGNPSFWRAALRETIGKWVSSLVLYLGFLWMLWDEGQQCWHDKIASTYVERV